MVEASSLAEVLEASLLAEVLETSSLATAVVASLPAVLAEVWPGMKVGMVSGRPLRLVVEEPEGPPVDLGEVLPLPGLIVSVMRFGMGPRRVVRRVVTPSVEV